VQSEVVIPEFRIYERGLEPLELDEIKGKMSLAIRTDKDRFRMFTDILLEYVGGGEWKNRSDAFLSMAAKACFLRGMYGYNQILAKGTRNLACKAYAAAAYCRQNLDPRWLNNLSNYVNQMWQSKDFVGFAELSGQLAAILADLGYYDRAREIAVDSTDKVTEATKKDTSIRNLVQAALLNVRIMVAYVATLGKSRDEALMRLESAEETARVLDHELALADISYYRALVLVDSHEYEKSASLVRSAMRKYERMGYLYGVANGRNLWGIIHMNQGELQDARDQFEELLVIQQQLNNQVGLARTLINVGEIDRMLGQVDQMETYNRRALEISQEAEYMRGMTIATLNLADVAVMKGKLDEALILYQKTIGYSESAGMRELHLLCLSQMSDVNFLRGELETAVVFAKQAREMSDEIGFPLYAFHAKLTELVTMWEMAHEQSDDLLEEVKQGIGPIKDWLDTDNSSPMVGVRRRVFDDRSVESDDCICYDPEKNFVCRVERKSLSKECFGNLFWMGSLCPFFRSFIERLYQ